MASTATRVSTRSGQRPARQRILPFEDHVLDLRNDSPDLFENYDEDVIADAMMTKLFPRGVEHKNVIAELMRDNLRTFRRRYDPNFDTQPRAAARKAPAPRTQSIVDGVLESFHSHTVMRDGRELGEWTWGEFRAEYKLFANAIAKGRNKHDNELIGTTLD